MSTPSKTAALRIAVIGGGITGAVAASRIAHSLSNVSIELFDQGRRGPGGRASHRRVQDGNVLPDDLPASSCCAEFDHGCQFFRADSDEMKALVASWKQRGWAQRWDARFGGDGDFFGVPTNDAPVYCGAGGMHTLPRSILAACDPSAVVVRAGVRVSSVEQCVCDAARWSLYGVGGAAAFHDTAEEQAQAAHTALLGNFDIVLATDVSSSFGAWHRASAGLPEAFAARVRGRVRVPLFAAMVAFDRPLLLPLDAFALAESAQVAHAGAEGSSGGGGGHRALWWAARNNSKPGVLNNDAGSESWTLISTPRYALAEIQAVPMQDAATGAFKPQEDGYLNGAGGPCHALLAEFKSAAATLVARQSGSCSGMASSSEGSAPPNHDSLTAAQVVYMQGQRWGSAIPAPASIAGRDCTGRCASTVEVLGVSYDGGGLPELIYDRPAAAPANDSTQDFVADDALGLYYAGDFCSRRNPGFEAAALSGAAVADHIVRVVLARL